MTLKRCIFAAKFKSKNSMKGMVELYYDMPHLATYLAASGAHFSENQLKNEICEFLEEAVLHHIEEKKFIIMGTLTKFLEGKEIVVGVRNCFADCLW